MAGIVPSRRVRGTPFTAGVQAAGPRPIRFITTCYWPAISKVMRPIIAT